LPLKEHVAAHWKLAVNVPEVTPFVGWRLWVFIVPLSTAESPTQFPPKVIVKLSAPRTRVPDSEAGQDVLGGIAVPLSFLPVLVSGSR